MNVNKINRNEKRLSRSLYHKHKNNKNIEENFRKENNNFERKLLQPMLE